MRYWSTRSRRRDYSGYFGCFGTQSGGHSLLKHLERSLTKPLRVASRRDPTHVDQRLRAAELVPREVDLDAAGGHVPVVHTIHPALELDVSDHQVTTEQPLKDQSSRSALTS
ncbi:MAG: hypothetical protein EOP01_04465 [Propionibacteriaceae bacterium]|nr:MAG: hypothetical protein EOP01_04465 [Propionibacteriaceae bacterium]